MCKKGKGKRCERKANSMPNSQAWVAREGRETISGQQYRGKLTSAWGHTGLGGYRDKGGRGRLGERQGAGRGRLPLALPIR